MRVLAKGLPVASLLVLALLGVLPWGHGDLMRFCLPAGALIAVHYWRVTRPDLLPAAAVWAVGLGIDTLTHGPLGYWSLVLLAGLALTDLVEAVLGLAERAAIWLGFVIVASGVAGTGWLIASVFLGAPVAWQPMALAVGVLVAAYPVVALPLAGLRRLVTGPRVLNFERGG